MNKILKYILTLCSLIACFPVFSVNQDKEFKKLINKYDVPKESKSLTGNNPALFWHEVLNGNELLAKFEKNIRKNKGAEKEAIKTFSELPRFYSQYDETLLPDFQSLCDSLLVVNGITDCGLNCSFHIVSSPVSNVFMVLTDDGFSVCMTDELLRRKGVTDAVVTGYVAHEFIHGALQHGLRRCYDVALKRRKDEVAMGIALGCYAFAAGLNPGANNMAYYLYLQDEYQDTQNSQKRTAGLQLIYSREQEYEADLIAFRFMQFLGCEDEYIEGLRILGNSYDMQYDSFEDHLSIPARISFLKYVQQHPELGNKSNAKICNERMYDSGW